MDSELIEKFEKIRNEPLDVENNRCWEKHIKLKKIFEDLGYETEYRVCSFLWSEQRIPKKIIDMIQEDLDYHLYLEVEINGLKLVIDASNDFLLPEYNIWDGKSSCNICVVPKEFINENIEEIIQNQLNKKYSSEQINFFKEVNLFFDSLRK